MQIDKLAKNIIYSCTRFSVVTAVTITMAVFWHVMSYSVVEISRLYIHDTVHRNKVICTNQPDALIIQIFSFIKLYMFRATSLPIIRSFLLYIRHW